MYKLSLVILSILIIGVSCNSPLDIEDNIKKTKLDSSVILPLSVGNIWYYKTTDRDDKGQINFTRFDTVQILSKQIINSTNWYEEWNTLTPEFNDFLSNSDTGLVRKTVEDIYYLDRRFPSQLNFIYDIPVGEIYLNDTLDRNRKVVSVSDEISVDAGNFTCYKYQDELLQDDIVIFKPSEIAYYSKGIGLIKVIFYRISDEGNLFVFREMELTDYDVD